MHRSVVAIALLAFLQTALVGLAIAQPPAQTVDFTDIRVTQFGRSESTPLPIEDKRFNKALEEACGSQPNPPPSAVLAVLGGIAVDWFFSRIMDNISKRIQKRVAEHTASYSNLPVYYDMLKRKPQKGVNAEDQPEDIAWAGDQTCLVMQSIECKAHAEAVKRGEGACINDAKPAFSAAITLRDKGDHLLMLPVASHLTVPKARHHQGSYVVSTTFRIQAMSYSDEEGRFWVSPESAAFSTACFMKKGEEETNCFQRYTLDDTRWKTASVLPKPPATVQAPVFTIGEVGTPSQGLKGFDQFMQANGAAVSAAFSDAMKKKLDIE